VPHLPAGRKKQFWLLMTLMMVGAVAELVTIGAVIPFIALLADPARAYEFESLQRLFAAVGWDQPETLALPMTVLFVAVVIVSAALRLLLLWVKNRFVLGIGYDIGVQLYGKVLAQPYSWHISRNTSSIIAVVNKVQVVVNGVLQPIMEAIIGMVTGLAIVALLLVIEPMVAITATVVFATFYLTVVRLMRLKLRRNGAVIADAQTGRVKAVQEGLGGIRDVLLDDTQDYYVAHFSEVDKRLRQAQATNNFIGGAPRFIIEPLGICLIVALAFYLASAPGGLMAALPTLGALALGAQRLLPLLQQLYNGWSKLMGNRKMFAEVLEHLELTRMRASNRVSQAMPFDKEIRLQDLSFRYSEATPWVIKTLNLSIPHGARVGLAGSTGSGKTTLMDILMGLLEPVEGRMTVDGVSVDGSNRRAWQQRIAHVPQFIYLADASIAENIAFGVAREDIDMERVREAAQRAQIAAFIEARDEAYESRVGERGIQLSGGQRQRIGIARALYKKADVLVFDEATSALDTQTETAVMEAISLLDSDLTVFIIAHRVQTLRECDLIVRLDQGRLVSKGSYQEVIEAEPVSTTIREGRPC
jgi:ABC-type multidrug transport system fused ATPase/permease subunit